MTTRPARCDRPAGGHRRSLAGLLADPAPAAKWLHHAWPDAPYAAEAGDPAQRWRCINIRPCCLRTRPRSGSPTAWRAL